MGETHNKHVKEGNTLKVLFWKVEGKGKFVRQSKKWEYNIETDLKRIGCNGGD
jgi:hypothetical protein